jgi:exoribonuclease-2
LSGADEAALPAIGTLLEIDQAGECLLAVVLGARKGRVDVATERGERFPISTAKVQLETRHRLACESSEDAAIDDALRALRGRIDAQRAALSLHTLWEAVVGDPDPGATLGELAHLWFGDVGPAELLATHESLRDDAVYFRRRTERFTPRPRAEVEQTVARMREAAARAAARERFLSTVAAALAALGSGAAPSPTQGALNSDPAFAPHLELLLDFAARGADYEDKDEALALLEELAERHPGRAYARSAAGALQLLVHLGVVRRHENLALRRYGIRTRFPADVLAEAEALAERPADVDGLPRLASGVPVFTIDDASTLDCDDALHARTLPDGTVEVGVHITDVGALIEPGSPVDLEARRRGASVYLPTGVIPMLPECLSEGRLSLVAGHTHPVLSFLVVLGRSGELLRSDIVRGAVHVTHRLSYDEADVALDDPRHPLHGALNLLDLLAGELTAGRTDAGAVAIDLPEVRVAVAAEGAEVRVAVRADSRSHAFVAEFMVLAGRIAAARCLERDIPSVYRVQPDPFEGPDFDAIEELADPLVRDLERVRHMRRGELRGSPAPHAGLGLDAYVQVTSPMRRYADLVMNYQLRRAAMGLPPAFDSDEIVDVAARAELSAAACTATQRDTNRYWLLEHLSRKRDEPVEAVVLFHDREAAKTVVPVVLPETMLRSVVAAKGVRPGQRIHVRVSKADPARDILTLELA